MVVLVKGQRTIRQTMAPANRARTVRMVVSVMEVSGIEGWKGRNERRTWLPTCSGHSHQPAQRSHG